MKKQLFKKTSIFIVVMAVVMAFALYMIPVPATAQENAAEGETATGDEGSTDDTDADQESSSFSNPAQAQHAANLAEALAAQPNPEVEAALDAVTEAEQDLADAIATENEEAIAEAQAALDVAKENAEAVMAENVGVTADDISAMRDEGMGWGQIAHQLGVHPGALGLGHTKGKMIRSRDASMGAKSDKQGKGKFGKPEIGEATARDTKTGLAKGRGVNTGNKSGSKSMGLGHAAKGYGGKSAAAGGKSVTGKSGHGSSKGSGKGSGGNSGGKGSGKGGGGKK